MRSALPSAKILMNKTHDALRVAARFASAFVPTRKLTPIINEALCYGCMAGIATPIHHDIAPFMDNSLAAQRYGRCASDDDDQVHKAVDFYNAGTTVLHVHLHGADGKGSKRMFVFNEMLDRLRTAVPKTVLQTEVLKLSHLVRHS